MGAVTKIAKNGVYAKLPMDFYHGDTCVGPSVSSSGLRTIFTQSPKHYFRDSYLNPRRRARKEGEHFVLGRAAHHLLLGEDDFSTLFVMRPDEIDDKPWHGNRTVCKEWLADQRESGRTVLIPDQIEAIRGMAQSLAEEPLVINGILNGSIETSLIWKDKATGVWLKSRPDAIPSDGGDFCDLKTTSSIGFDLDRDISNYRYDMQAGLAGMGYRELFGEKMSSFSFCFVEKDAPYSVEVLTLGPEDIANAEKDLRVAIDTFAWCVEHDNWFSPAGTQRDARYVHISDWVKKNAEVRRDFLRREIARAERVDAEAI